jgi:hypothetical protein
MVEALQTMIGATTKSSVLTIFFIFYFLKHASYILEKNSDFYKSALLKNSSDQSPARDSFPMSSK